MLDRLTLPALPTLPGPRVVLREFREADVDDRLREPIDPEEEDAYGSEWRREWDGRRYHTREYLTANREPPEPGVYTWAVEHGGHCIGSAGLRVNTGQHRATYTVGLFVAALRGRGLGREVTRLVLAWAFGPLGVHRVELEVLAGNDRAIRCYLACGVRHEGIRREAELYPDGWQDFISMGLLRSEFGAPGHLRELLLEGDPGRVHREPDVLVQANGPGERVGVDRQ
ncbi:MAG: GNAT family N-acetyltransferase [Streptosporangiaceae bacterium]